MKNPLEEIVRSLAITNTTKRTADGVVCVLCGERCPLGEQGIVHWTTCPYGMARDWCEANPEVG